jgi:ribosome-binding protein aMBF1 (putative translation factor)
MMAKRLFVNTVIDKPSWSLYIFSMTNEEEFMGLNALIGERIAHARIRRGWNQSELARRLGKPRQHLSQIEQGKQQPRAELLVDLATVLGVSTDYLLGRTQEGHRPAAQDTAPPPPQRPRRRTATPVS